MKVAVLAEQNFNAIDGSTIWLLNACRALAFQPDFDVTLFLRWNIESRVLVDELPPAVKIVEPRMLARADGGSARRVFPKDAATAITDYEGQNGRFDRFFVRGDQFLNRLVEDKAFSHRIVANAPGVSPRAGGEFPFWISKGAEYGARVIVQSQASKAAMEAIYRYPASLIHVSPPFADPAKARPRDGSSRRSLCYAGKIDVRYGLDWLVDLAGRDREAGRFRIDIVAGKDTNRLHEPEFFEAYDALKSQADEGEAPHLRIATNVPHSKSREILTAADFSYCLRHDEFDDSLEISTKVVESVVSGVPPIVNDNHLNRRFFGDDYPFFVDAADDPVARVIEILTADDDAALDRARSCLERISHRHSLAVASESMADAVRGFPGGAADQNRDLRRVMIVGHEFKFTDRFENRLRADPGTIVSHRKWPLSFPVRAELKRPSKADTILCEWCGANAIWYSKNKPEGTKLIVRLHRFEMFRRLPKEVDWSAVDRLIVVSDHFRQLAIDELGVDANRIVVFPQYVNWDELRRPKQPRARFNIGLVGVNPYDHKRFDRAIEFLRNLRARDPRFTMTVRSAMPWEIDWVWNNLPDDRRRYEALFEMLFNDPDLSGAIAFEAAGSDMEEWYRDIGFILSSSDTEGCHTSVIEAMASGGVPIVYDWPGAQSLFSPYVYKSLDDAIPDVIAAADDPALDERREVISQSVAKWDLEEFFRMFMEL